MQDPTTVVVRAAIDVFEARRVARDLAVQHGFGTLGSQCAAIVASELATNIVKHGVEGTLRVEALLDDEPALRLVARDRGPEIGDFARALVDRSDARGPLDPAAAWGRGGIGSGLGAIARLSDAFEYQRFDGGNQFEAVLLRAASMTRRPWRARSPV